MTMHDDYMADDDDQNIDQDGYDSEEEFIDDTQFEDPEGYVDEVSEEDLVGDLLDNRPNESDSLDTVVIVDNIPVVGPSRMEKLKTIIRKVFSKFGTVVNEFYPEENGETKGFIFLEYSNASDAQHAVKAANGYKLDKNHTFAVNSFADFDKYKNVTDEWVPSEPRPYEDRGNLQAWLQDQECNDQYSIVQSDSESNVNYSTIYQNGPTLPNLVSKRTNWTDTFMVWSPKGTYLATMHRQGVCLWGGEEFKRLNRFNHTNAQLIDFSPCERYLISYSPEYNVDNPQDPSEIIIYDIRSGQKKRGFHAGTGTKWPTFKWSHDGSYFARQSEENLFIYETPGFGLVDKKSIQIPDLKDFTWSPSNNHLVYWVPELGETPARVVVMEMPSKREIRVKNLFHVADCKFHWQKNGDYLCVKVERYTKSKKGVYYNLELFRMKDKEIAVDTLEIKDSVAAIEWEPNGSKFCVIHGENPICASFYEVQETQQRKVTLLKTFEKRTVNTISWAPFGQFVVLAGLRSMNGVLEFVDTSDMTVMATEEHYMATDIDWDPSGRYFMSAVSFWSHKVDNAYFIWSFQGKILQRNPMKEFCSFLWRPRPKGLLSEEDKSNIKKDMKRYQKLFEVKDKMTLTKASKELIDQRRKMFNSFTGFRNRHRENYEDYKQARMDLRGGIDTDNMGTEEYDEETFEFFVKEEIQVIEATNDE